ncbi:unnamed protein product [Pleuronectes platessa]|uniref:Uncharacterized protein n=1 Tax=Pleuronectes platessa TaxID=8262 RepID=A0A9N7V4Q3_PLEPL|nr:unnamed protein product [Pleuronectes platessa]
MMQMSEKLQGSFRHDCRKKKENRRFCYGRGKSFAMNVGHEGWQAQVSLLVPHSTPDSPHEKYTAYHCIHPWDFHEDRGCFRLDKRSFILSNINVGSVTVVPQIDRPMDEELVSGLLLDTALMYHTPHADQWLLIAASGKKRHLSLPRTDTWKPTQSPQGKRLALERPQPTIRASPLGLIAPPPSPSYISLSKPSSNSTIFTPRFHPNICSFLHLF